jgi:hypothetical protein
MSTEAMKDVAGQGEIEDVCWELFGGGCGQYQTLEEMQYCPRKIRTCDLYVVRFRQAVGLLRAQERAPKAAPAEEPAKSTAKPEPKPGAAAEKGEGKSGGKASARGSGPVEKVAASSAPAPVEGGIRFAFAGKADKVEVAGSFNGWQPVPLAKGNAGATWAAVVAVPPGEHTYKLVVDGAWIKPPEAPAYAPDGQGGENGVLTI